MSNFALDVNSPQGDIVGSLNYALANLGQGGTSSNLGNVLTANITTGVISTPTSNGALSYLYQYMNVAYANTATGGGFTSNSTATTYYGVHNNTANVADTNPVDYQWTQVSGGFGTTKSLFYQTLGGRQIAFNVATTSPGYYYRSVQDNVPINLDDVTSTQAIYTATIFRRGNVTPATPTGGTYNFGNLFLNPPSGWSANTPPADGNTYIFTSQNTFLSSQAFVNAPSKAWTFPTLFTANGANGANGAPGTNGVSTFDYTVYTATSFLPNTPQSSTGSWNFTTSVGVPPTDPNTFYIPYILPNSTITTSTTYRGTPNSSFIGNVVNIYSNTVANVTYPSITNTYYTFFANTYTLGNVLSNYGAYTDASYPGGTSYGNAYVDTFTVTGNTAYADLMLIAGGQTANYNTGTGIGRAGQAGNILVVSNVALTIGTYSVYHGPGVSTTISGPGGTWTAPFNGASGTYAGLATNGANAVVNGTGILGGSTYTANGLLQGGAGFPDPWAEITWLGQMSGTYTWANGTAWSGANVAYFGGGGGQTSSTGTRSYGGLGAGPNISNNPAVTINIGGSNGSYRPGSQYPASTGYPGTGSGGGANDISGDYESFNYAYPNPIGFPTALNALGAAGGSGAAIIRKHNSVANPPNIATWSNTQPSATNTLSVYSSTALAFTNNIAVPVTTLVWQPSAQISGNTGIAGNTGARGIIPMAYVATSSDPTSYTTGQYTYAFTANRANVATPIGTGYSPIQGDVAQFVYTPTNTIVVKEYDATANVWTAVNGQVISGNVFVTGSVNATALNANDVYTLNLRGGLGVVGNVDSPGFWMQASTGDARMAGNTSIGNNLTVGNNAVVGNNLTIGSNLAVGTNAIIGNNLGIGNNAVIGNSLTVGTNASIGANLAVGNYLNVGNYLTVGTNAIIGDNLGVGDNAIIGNNLSVGNNTVIGNSLYVGVNAQIGGNLQVAGLITGGNLNGNTVQTTTIQLNAVSDSSANIVPSTPAYVTTSPSSSAWYSMACNVTITTTQTSNAFLISGLADPNLIFAGAVPFGSYYLLNTRVVCVDPTGNVSYPVTVSTPVIGNSNFTNIYYRTTIPQYLSPTYTSSGTYTFYLQQGFTTGNDATNPTSLQDQGRSLTVTLLKR